MTTCWACEAQLDPAWKFCIRCGVPVEQSAIARQLTARTREPVSAYALFGWILAGIGVALLLTGVILYLVMT